MSDAPNLLLTWLKVDRRSAASLKNMLAVAFFLLASSFTEGGHGCRVVDFLPPRNGSRLENHVFDSERVTSAEICQILCFMNDACRSFNFRHPEDDSDDGLHLCELNNSTREEHSASMKNDPDFSYQATQNPCLEDPCTENQQCVPGGAPEGYRCVCRPGHMGDSCGRVQSCNDVAGNGKQNDGPYELGVDDTTIRVYCDLTVGQAEGWTLIARFSNGDSKNWMKNSGEYWFDTRSAVGQTTDPADNSDMISPAFWSVNGTEFKITRSDDPNHTALLQTTGGCLGGQTFRSKVTSYGDFRDSKVWATDQCLGSCDVLYGGNYDVTQGFRAAQCSSDMQTENKIGFWCDYEGNGAVLTIGGAGSGCYKAAHGVGITEADESSFKHDQHDVFYMGVEDEYDFGNVAWNYAVEFSYSLNLWVR